MTLRIQLWPSLITLLGVAVMVWLGFWQLDRLEWKRGEIAKRESRSQGPAVDLPLDLREPEPLAFLRVRLAGRFLHDREFHFGGRPKGGRVGWHIVTPFELDSGRILFVDRGWVPPERLDPARRAEGQQNGRLSLEAILRPGGWSGYALFRPENQPEDNYWIWPDLPGMADHAGLEGAITTLYGEAVAGPVPGGLPEGGQTRLTLPNRHLEYALTWFALAGVLAVIYLIYSYRGGRLEEP